MFIEKDILNRIRYCFKANKNKTKNLKTTLFIMDTKYGVRKRCSKSLAMLGTNSSHGNKVKLFYFKLILS